MEIPKTYLSDIKPEHETAAISNLYVLRFSQFRVLRALSSAYPFGRRMIYKLN